jgi:hypothetical protein
MVLQMPDVGILAWLWQVSDTESVLRPLTELGGRTRTGARWVPNFLLRPGGPSGGLGPLRGSVRYPWVTRRFDRTSWRGPGAGRGSQSFPCGTRFSFATFSRSCCPAPPGRSVDLGQVRLRLSSVGAMGAPTADITLHRCLRRPGG